MDTVLITGVAGFIGSHTAEKLLQEGYKVIGIDNLSDYYDINLKKRNLDRLAKSKNFHFLKIDIREPNELSSLYKINSFEYIIHLAALAGVRNSNSNPLLYQQVNIGGTTNILELGRITNCGTFILASTSSVYGNQPKFPVSETASALKPLSIYAATKQACESLSYSYNYVFGMNINCLRFFTVYGPHGRPDMSPYIFTKNIIEEKPIKLYDSPHGTIERDFTFISDVVRGIIKALKFKEGYNVFNIASGEKIKLIDFITLLEEEIGKKAILEYHPRISSDVKITYADIGKAKSALNFNPKVKIKQGVKAYVDWYKSFYV